MKTKELHILQYILQEEANIKHLQLELLSQFTPHSEKDKLASVSYDRDNRLNTYEAYAQTKATIAKNTMSSAPNFEPACISNVEQKMVLPTYHVLNQKSEALNEPTPPPLP